MKIPCIALREFYYDKEMTTPNKPCMIDEKDVEVLELAQAIKRDSDGRSKRQYRRRDMTAEQP